jgi:D-3-phosphoglycerate dehydrogenase / 2-oxoglutarate reductase
MKDVNILAVILARGGSKGIKKKNIKLINNHPLISYSIAASLNSKFINKLIVSSDSKEIINLAREYGADAPFVRPKKLSGDKVPSVTALKHAVLSAEKFYKTRFDFIIELPCVSPLRDNLDIDTALKLLIKKKYDSVISYVNTGEKHPTRLKRIKKNKVTPFCRDYPEPDIGSRRQDFESCYIRNGAIYAMSRKTLIENNSRNGNNSFPYIMEDKKSINIDAQLDFTIAEMLIKKGFCNNYPKKILKNKIFRASSKKKNLLITSPVHFIGNIKKKLKKKYNTFFAYNINLIQLQKIIGEFDAWICHPAPKFKINSEILSLAKKLKVISTPSTGTNHIDLNYCEKKKIHICSIRNSKFIKNIKASSEFTFSLIISAFKNLHQGILNGKVGNWRENEEYLRGNQLYKKKIGIIGYGRIGSNISRYASAFGMNINAYDPFKKIKDKNVKQHNNLHNMLKICDVILISIHLNKENYNFFNIEKFKSLKKNVILINTSRGEIVDEKALVKSFKSNKIKFYATDVVCNEHELPTKKSKIFSISNNKNVYITPHMAGLTYESEEIAANIAIENIENFYKNEK